MIKIEELKLEEFEEKYDAIVKLEYENVCLHFPDKNIDLKNDIEPSIKEIRQYMKISKAFIFIASENKKTIGYLWCYPRRFFDESRIYINSLIVSKQYRGKQIGEELMKKVETKAKELNCDSIYVTTAAFNDGALKFYRRQNYIDERVQLVKKI